LIARLVLAAVFVVAAVAKLADQAGTRRVLSELRLPNAATAFLALGIPLAEAAIAAALIPDATAPSGAIAAIALLAVFAVGITHALLNDRRPECNCFGSLHSKPLGWGMVVRNVVLALFATLILVATEPTISTGDLPFVIGGVILAGALAFQGWFSWQLFRQNGRLLARLEKLEQRSASDLSSAKQLQAGEPAPAFDLRGLDGETYSLEDLLGKERPLALVFTDPGCGACDEVMIDIALRSNSSDELEVAVISRGAVDANRSKMEPSGLQPVLLQVDQEVAQGWKVDAVPTVVLVSSDGRIASDPATGRFAIQQLLDGFFDAHPSLQLITAGGS
jgi:peroxiredoxin